LYTQAACINWLPKPSYFRIGFLWLVVMLSPTILSHRTSLSIFMMLSLTCVLCWECLSSICHDARWPWWGLMLWFEQGLNGVGWNPSGEVVCHARIFLEPSHRSRHPRTTCATMCPVWNGLLSNYECCGKCALLRWVGNYHSYSSSLTRCKRGRGTIVGVVTRPGLPRETLALLLYCDYLS
jgi:hypothetical protein